MEIVENNDTPVIPVPGQPLLDQRVVLVGNDSPEVTPEVIEMTWSLHKANLERTGRMSFPERIGEPLEFIEADDELVAFVGTGRWIASCPHCNGGISLWKDNPRAACLDCGRIYSNIKWPDEKELAEGTRALEARPNRLDRFWHPEQQEAVELRLENVNRGIGTPQPEDTE